MKRRGRPPNRKPEPALPTLTGPEALRVMIPEFVAIDALLQGPTVIAETLVRVVEAEIHREQRPLTAAWMELAKRASTVSGELTNRASLAKIELQRAQAAYSEAIAPLRYALFAKE